MWIMSVSAKFASQGVFGSDLYAGFAGADKHYFINLPLVHVLQAMVFRVLGAGVTQARLVSLLSALVLLWTVTWLAWRWFGLLPALLTSVLLVLWRSHLIGMDFGIPLLAVARTARYDLPTVALIWLAVLFLDIYLERFNSIAAFATGVCAGLAILTQFFGVLVVPLIASVLFWQVHRPESQSQQHSQRRLPARHVLWMIAGLLLVILPYMLFAALHWRDAVTQFAYSHASRFAFGPKGLWNNLLGEWRRYEPLVGQPGVGSWLVLIGIWPALAYLVYCLLHDDNRGYRILAVTLVVTALVLASSRNYQGPCVCLGAAAVHLPCPGLGASRSLDLEGAGSRCSRMAGQNGGCCAAHHCCGGRGASLQQGLSGVVYRQFLSSDRRSDAVDFASRRQHDWSGTMVVAVS